VKDEETENGKKPKIEKETGAVIEFIPVEEEEKTEESGAGIAQKIISSGNKNKEKTEEKGSLLSEEKKSGDEPALEEAKVKEAGEEAGRLKSRLHKKEAEIKALRKERDEWKDKYLRALAEMDNARKRLEREREEFTRFALSDFLREVLLVVDNLERALASRDEANGRLFQEGVVMIYRQLIDLLRKLGVKPLEREDKKFDPNVHQALITEEADGIEEPEVAEYLQKGYWLHDRLLRPALVKVLVPKKNP